MKRGDVVWAEIDGLRHPYVVMTRDGAGSAERVLATLAQITTQIRDRPFEAPEPESAGLDRECVVNADALVTWPKAYIDPQPVGWLSAEDMAAVDVAVHYALALSRPA